MDSELKWALFSISTVDLIAKALAIVSGLYAVWNYNWYWTPVYFFGAWIAVAFIGGAIVVKVRERIIEAEVGASQLAKPLGNPKEALEAMDREAPRRE